MKKEAMESGREDIEKQSEELKQSSSHGSGEGAYFTPRDAGSESEASHPGQDTPSRSPQGREHTEGDPPKPAQPEREDSEEESEKDEEVDVARRIEEAERKAAEYLEMAQRIKADYENYRKRMLKEQTHHLEHAASQLIESLLPVLDSFELALANLDQIRASHEAVAKGIELVYAELMATLGRAGLSRIDESGVSFDPHIHHALEREGAREIGAEEYVAAVLRPGYKLKRHVLRPAEVKVGYRKPAASN